MPDRNPMPYDFMPNIDPDWNNEDDALTKQSLAGSLEAADDGGIKVDGAAEAAAEQK